MHEEVIISGFGGQGVLFAGQLLSYAGMKEGKHVTWLPSYGPEIRGGTARCTVIVSDEEIGSPLTDSPTAAIVMNLPSMEMFEPRVSPEGLLVINSSMVPRSPSRDDITTLRVPANDIAEELGNRRLANMVVLGALLEATGVVSLDSAIAALEESLPERHRHLLELNKEALRRGAEIARNSLPL